MREEAFENLGFSDQPDLELREEIQIDGRMAIRRVFNEPNVFGNNADNTVYVVNIYLVDDPYTYTFLLSAETEKARDKYMADFDKIVQSMQIAP